MKIILAFKTIPSSGSMENKYLLITNEMFDDIKNLFIEFYYLKEKKNILFMSFYLCRLEKLKSFDLKSG